MERKITKEELQDIIHKIFSERPKPKRRIKGFLIVNNKETGIRFLNGLFNKISK